MVAEDVVDVVIAGAGPCGLLLANDLARRGASDLKLVVLDAAAGPSVHTKAMAVQLRTLEVFDDLGCVDRALDEGFSLTGVRSYLGKNQEVFAKLKNLPGAPFPGMLVFPQFRNEDMLLDMLEEACGGRKIVQYSTKIVDYDETPEYIDVKVDGPEGERFIKTRFLVGAEGAHSVVRHRLGVPFPGRKFEEEFFLCDCEIEKDAKDAAASNYLGPGEALSYLEKQMCILFPYKDGSYRIIGMRAPQDEGKEVTLAEVQKVVDLFPVKLTVKNPKWMSNFRLHSRVVDQYGDNERVFLVGDAAHIHSPVGGQGMNTGMQDSYNLGWKLHMAIKGQASQTLLKTFSEERQPVGSQIINGTDQAFRMAVGHGAAFNIVRSFLFSWPGRKFLLPILETKAPQLVSQLWVNYKTSSISVSLLPRSIFRYPLVAGQRFPYFESMERKGATCSSLDILRGTSFTLIFATAAADEKPVALGEAKSAVGRLPGCRLVILSPVLSFFHVEEEGGWESYRVPHLKSKILGPMSGALMLVRPDGYLGYIEKAGKKSELEAYVSKLVK